MFYGRPLRKKALYLWHHIDIFVPEPVLPQNTRCRLLNRLQTIRSCASKSGYGPKLMFQVVTVFIVLLLAVYLSGLVILHLGMRRLVRQTRQQRRPPHEWPSVAVIVAARNEAQNLPRLLTCLRQLDYPTGRLELCVVDDRSSDGTWALLQQAEQEIANFKAIRITDTRPDFGPKKRALAAGIRATHGEILLLTDADCSPPSTWVQAMVEHYQPDTAIVPGYSPYRFDTPVPQLLRGMLALDFFALATIAAATSGLGKPATAAGCNLSYRRSTYEQAGGFGPIQHWVSGDDDLFLQLVVRKKLGSYAYAYTPEAAVPGAAPARWQQFWHQRIRYASKSLHYNLPMTLALAAVYLLNLFCTATVPLALFGPPALAWLAAICWVAKSGGEYLFLRHAAAAFGENRLLKFFLPAALCHPPYIVLFAFLGAFSRFQWKDARVHKVQTSEATSHAD